MEGARHGKKAPFPFSEQERAAAIHGTIRPCRRGMTLPQGMRHTTLTLAPSRPRSWPSVRLPLRSCGPWQPGPWRSLQGRPCKAAAAAAAGYMCNASSSSPHVCKFRPLSEVQETPQQLQWLESTLPAPHTQAASFTPTAHTFSSSSNLPLHHQLLRHILTLVVAVLQENGQGVNTTEGRRNTVKG